MLHASKSILRVLTEEASREKSSLPEQSGENKAYDPKDRGQDNDKSEQRYAEMDNSDRVKAYHLQYRFYYRLHFGCLLLTGRQYQIFIGFGICQEQI
jgi:hypothetical protein